MQYHNTSEINGYCCAEALAYEIRALNECADPGYRLSPNACRWLILIALTATALCLSDPTYAQSFGRINTALQTLVDFMTGTTGRLLAILGVAGLGIAAWFGRLSYSRAGEIIVGIAIVFGSAEIVDLFAR
jgi:type IV secretory pathway VirB2 component (pilin)